MYAVKCAPSDPAMSTEADMYWLAGLLEGEGSFLKGPPSSPGQPIVQLPMTDQDVVERAARLFDRAVTPWDRSSERPRKRVFITAIKGAAAVRVMRALYPVMGVRRRTQIDLALDVTPVTKLRALVRDATCSVTACGLRVRSRGLCRRHYDSWWKATRRGRAPRHPAVELLPPAARATALAMHPADDVRSISWLAGLLEGEGAFATRAGYPGISVTMCDRDVLKRAATVMNIERVWRKAVIRNEDRGWSPAFAIGITGARAAEWMHRLRPLMGQRRAQQIGRALAAYHPIRLTKAPGHCVVVGCEGPHRGRGLCHKHYMAWDRDRRAGRVPKVTPLR